MSDAGEFEYAVTMTVIAHVSAACEAYAERIAIKDAEKEGFYVVSAAAEVNRQ